MSIQQLRQPWEITTFITQPKKAALISARGPRPEEALTGFCDTMETLLTAAGRRMNHINFAAVITALAHVWKQLRATTDARLEALYQRYVLSLQHLLANMVAQELSTVMWASAKLGFNPDAVSPGTVHALTLGISKLIDGSDEKQRPNAQACANMVWALATMSHPAATAELLDSVCLRFAKTRHPDAKQRPKAQEASNMLWALATLGHQAAAKVLDSVTTHFADLVGSPNSKQQPDAQAVANVFWASGTLKHNPPDDKLLESLLAHFQVLLRSEDQRSCPDAQNIANALWALKELRHAPSNAVVSAMLAHLEGLCQAPGLQPTSQAISNCLLAFAELRVSVNSTYIDMFVEHLLGVQVSQVACQTYGGVAWSLAIMGSLTISMFDALVHQISCKSASGQPSVVERQQLHQALALLKPAPGLQQIGDWSTLRSRLQAVAPEPAVVLVPFPGQAEVYAALEMQTLPYKAQVPFGKHWAHAVLSSGTSDVLLVFHPPQDFIRNMPTRVLGHVALKSEMLSRYGTVVTIPYDPDKSIPEALAADIKAAVEAKTGLRLDAFRN